MCPWRCLGHWSPVLCAVSYNVKLSSHAGGFLWRIYQKMSRNVPTGCTSSTRRRYDGCLKTQPKGAQKWLIYLFSCSSFCVSDCCLSHKPEGCSCDKHLISFLQLSWCILKRRQVCKHEENWMYGDQMKPHHLINQIILTSLSRRMPYRNSTARRASSPDPPLSHVAVHGRCSTSCFGPPCCYRPSSTLLVAWSSAAPLSSSSVLPSSSS